MIQTCHQTKYLLHVPFFAKASSICSYYNLHHTIALWTGEETWQGRNLLICSEGRNSLHWVHQLLNTQLHPARDIKLQHYGQKRCLEWWLKAVKSTLYLSCASKPNFIPQKVALCINWCQYRLLNDNSYRYRCCNVRFYFKMQNYTNTHALLYFAAFV